MNKKLFIYLNGILNIVGAFGYFMLAFLMQVDSILLMLFTPFIILFGATLTAGTLFAIGQLFIGLYYLLKKNEEGRYHLFSVLLWLIGILIFKISIEFGYIVTV